MALVVRTQSGSVYELLGPDRYMKNGEERRCLAWGAVVQGALRPGLGLALVGLAPQPGGAVPVVIPTGLIVGRALVEFPLGFVFVKDGVLRFSCTTPVAEVDGGGGTPEGDAGPLPPDIVAKLLGEGGAAA